METWKDIQEYENLYQVSDLGNIKSLINLIVLNPTENSRGYMTVTLYKQGIGKSFTVHSLVINEFEGVVPKGKVIDHKDTNKKNNRLDNLRIIDHRENVSLGWNNTKSGHRGVTWHKKSKKWMARIRINGKRKSLGYFDTIEEASEAYQKELIKIQNND